MFPSTWSRVVFQIAVFVKKLRSVEGVRECDDLQPFRDWKQRSAEDGESGSSGVAGWGVKRPRVSIREAESG